MIIKMKKNNYKQYQNVEQSLIINKNLSPAQLGVLIRLLSLPDEWNFSVIKFAKLYNISEYSLRRDLNNLESLGYISIPHKGVLTVRTSSNDVFFSLLQQNQKPMSSHTPLSFVHRAVKHKKRYYI